MASSSGVSASGGLPPSTPRSPLGTQLRKVQAEEWAPKLPGVLPFSPLTRWGFFPFSLLGLCGWPWVLSVALSIPA